MTLVVVNWPVVVVVVVMVAPEVMATTVLQDFIMCILLVMLVAMIVHTFGHVKIACSQFSSTLVASQEVNKRRGESISSSQSWR